MPTGPVTIFTDPYCPWSWAAEPLLRRLEVEFGAVAAPSFVIVGLHRQIEKPGEPALDALAASAKSRIPSLQVRGPHGECHGAYGPGPYERRREAMLAAGLAPATERPAAEEAVRRWGSMATPEVAAAGDPPGPRAPAELWRLATGWRIRARPVPGGVMWSPTG
jgi:hypothetical protein